MLFLPVQSGAEHVGQDVYQSRLTIRRYLRPRIGPPLTTRTCPGETLRRQTILIFGRIHANRGTQVIYDLNQEGIDLLAAV